MATIQDVIDYLINLENVEGNLPIIGCYPSEGGSYYNTSLIDESDIQDFFYVDEDTKGNRSLTLTC